MNSLLVSVVMPLRNAEATVAEAVTSLQRQTWPNLEIVLVDHASEDNSPAILEEMAARDERIHYVRHDGTFVEAANLAWQSAQGDLIARMDSDDVAHAERIEKQVRMMETNPELSACGTLVNIVKRGENGATLPPDGGYKRYEDWVNSVVTHEEIFVQRYVDSPVPNPPAMVSASSSRSVGSDNVYLPGLGTCP